MPPRSSRPPRAACLRLATLLGMTGSACVGTVVPHSQGKTLNDLPCTEMDVRSDYFQKVPYAEACGTFKVKDGSYIVVLVKAPANGLRGTVEILAEVDGGQASQLKSKQFSVGASTKPQGILGMTLSGGKHSLYVVHIKTPTGTPQFSYNITN